MACILVLNILDLVRKAMRTKTGFDVVRHARAGRQRVGSRGDWTPFARHALAVEASVAIAGFRPLLNVQVLDGYEPFEGGLRARRLTMGISWRMR